MVNKKDKQKWKYGSKDILKDYLWIVGLALFVGGLIKIFDAFSIMVVGIIAFLVGACIKGGKKK